MLSHFELVTLLGRDNASLFQLPLCPHNIYEYKSNILCTLSTNVTFYLQDLGCLNRDLSKVIIVDCDPKAYKTYSRNAVGLKKWMGNDDDRTLVDLAHFLRSKPTLHQ